MKTKTSAACEKCRELSEDVPILFGLLVEKFKKGGKDELIKAYHNGSHVLFAHR